MAAPRLGHALGSVCLPAPFPAPLNYFVDLPQSRFCLPVCLSVALARFGLHCNISSSFPAKNELLSGNAFVAGKRASSVLTCGPIYSSIAG